MTHPIHHLPDPQSYAVDQQRKQHEDALYAFGEYAFFVLMWNLVDHHAGLVDRCPTCYTSYAKTARAYGQASVKDCPNCFGTTFEGGYKARIVRPSLWDANEEDYRENKRGQVIIATASIQSTADFRMRTGDHILRADGTRWRMRTISTNHLRTGFGSTSPGTTAIGFNYGQVSREDESAVAYQLPPTDAALVSEVLSVTPGARHPVDFSEHEVIHGPLL